MKDEGPVNYLPPGIFAVEEGIYGGLTGLSFALFVAMSVMIWKRPNLGRTTLIFYLISSVNLILLNYFVITWNRTRSSTTMYRICNIWDWAHRFQATSLYCDATFRDLHRPSVWDTDVADQFDVVQVVLIWISDAAIAYRAGALARSRVSRITLGTLYGLCFFSGIFVILSGLQDVGGLEGQVASCISYIFLCSSILSNLISTGLFGYILWTHRRLLQEVQMNRNGRKSLSDRILSGVVESGVVYCAFQISFTGYSSARPDYSCYIWQALYFGVSGIYPALILLVANAQAPWNDEAFEEYLSTAGMGNNGRG